MNTSFIPGTIDYEGAMARDFTAGRALLIDNGSETAGINRFALP